MSINNRKTPIMGWASWNCFGPDISEEKMKMQADALVSTGLAEYGYEYFNMDDGFFGGRDADGKLIFHKTKFPNGIKNIAEYAHTLGLKAGIYSDGGKNSCSHYWHGEGENGVNVGLYGYEEQDLKLFLEEYGFDFIKVDWCGGQKQDLDEEEQYTKIANIIEEIRERTQRCIVFNICRWQFPGEWATKLADSWRTGADIAPDFNSMVYQIDSIRSFAKFASPGHVNDLDMMQLGNGLSHDEEKSHFAMWCMMSTPLMIGCDLTKIADSTLEILKNSELIALNQDSACLQAYVAKEITDNDGKIVGDVWIKNLGCDNSPEKAVAFFNRSEDDVTFNIDFSDIGLAGEIVSARDLWEHKDILPEEMISVHVSKHCTKVFRVKATESIPIENKDNIDKVVVEQVKKVSYNDLKSVLADNGMLVDVRNAELYNESHLEGAVNIPYNVPSHWFWLTYPHKDQTIVIYCKTGKRSLHTRDLLVYLGFKNVYVLTDYEDKLGL